MKAISSKDRRKSPDTVALALMLLKTAGANGNL